MKRLLALLVLIAATTVVSGLSRTSAEAQSGNDLFQQALSKERAEGKLDEAILLYARVVKEFANDRALAAKALVQMGQCYERLGKTEAKNAYDRVLREYADQRAAADEARGRLAALTRPDSRQASGPTTRQVWGSEYVDVFGSVSPDGRSLSFTDWDTGDLAVRDLGSGVNRRLTAKGSWNQSPEHAEFSVISPDGGRIAYEWTNKDDFGDLRLIGMNGGKPRVLYHNPEVHYLQPFDWSPDGRQILATFSRLDRTNQLVLVSADDGAVRVLKTFDWRFPWKAAFSPDGRWVAYDFPPMDDAPERDLFLIAVDGSREVPLVTHRAHDFLLGWVSRSDRVLFASDRAGTTGAWTIRVENGRPRGEAELVKPNIGHVLAMSFTRSGDYFYAPGTSLRDVSIAARDPATGKLLEPLTPLKGRFEEGKLAGVWSPDGIQLAYLEQSPLVRGGEGANTLAVHTLETRQVRSVPLKMSYAVRLRWLPDGRALVVQGTDLKGRKGLFRVDVSTGSFEPIVYGPISRYAVGPDGRRLFYVTGAAIVQRDLQTGEERDVYRLPASSGLANSGLALSPDGRWLALKINVPAEDGRPSIQVVSTSGGEPRTLVTLPEIDNSTWRELAWSPDGKFVFFTKLHQELWQVPAAGGPSERLAGDLSYINSISIHPDGRRIAVSAGSAKHEIWVMEHIIPSAPARTQPVPPPKVRLPARR